MPTTPLANIPNGSNVFIDANIFVYALSGQSPQCSHLLERCGREEITGITLFEIVNEAAHRFMLAEAYGDGHIKSINDVRGLRSKFSVISSLTEYWRNTERILSLNLLLLATEESILKDAQKERPVAFLLTNDSMVVACMRQYGISQIATADGDFARVSGITVYSPDDLP
ncbi:MAG: type II toxin-antitoxin system VapC family toxin [Verrucomicrobia bacterium]|nr:type II toxin-antitoxin system VapC family toxin [Verrucomicrobiota bacterium]